MEDSEAVSAESGASVSTESQTEQTNETETTESNDNQPRSKGYAPFVDLSGVPDEIRAPLEGRFAHLSRIIKGNQQELREYQRIAAEQSARIEELTSGFGSMVNHLQDQTYAETESNLKAQLRQALEVGDNERYIDLQDKLLDLKAEKKLAAKQEQPKQQQQRRVEPVGDPMVAAEDVQFINSWQAEEDEYGNPLRPWAFNRGTQERPDPTYLAALAETQAVLRSPRFANKTMEEKMAEVDRRMGLVRTERRQTVMGGNLTGNRKTSKITLSPEAEQIAIKTQYAGRGKSNQEHLEAYRKQLEKTKGARK